MSAKPILQATDSSDAILLRKDSLPVPETLFNTAELSQILTDMIDTLDGQPDGVALAAPQIGIQYRMFIVRHDRTIAPPKRL